jgi:hypothetical protein
MNVYVDRLYMANEIELEYPTLEYKTQIDQRTVSSISHVAGFLFSRKGRQQQ